MTRIVAGEAGGVRLKVPASGTRPTSERVREAIFSRLAHLGFLEESRVLDLYAGSGALGLEAVSRGAASAVLVESGRAAANLCTANAKAARVADRVRVEATKVETYLRGGIPETGFDLVFADPPYALTQDELAANLAALATPGWLSDDAMVVVERDTRSGEPIWPRHWHEVTGKKYGETTVFFSRV